MRAFSAFLLFLTAQPVQSAVVPAGTRVDARLESSVQTATSDPGDAIVALLAEPIRAAGMIVVPRGSRLNGRVETVEPASRTSEGRVRLVFREIQFPDGRTVSTWITNSFSASPPNRKLRYVLYMGIGGVAGALLGGKAARTTGAIGGTLVGFVIAGNSDDDKLPDLDLRPGQILRLQLGENLRMD
jgi:hypothetical protein